MLSTLLYGAESWTVYMAQAHSLNAYMMRHRRQILGVKCIPNQDILMKTNMSSMYETLIHRNLRWAGHLIRLDNTRLPKQILYSQLKEGHRSVGRPKLRFKDTIKRNLAQKGIPPGSWDKKANDRPLWRELIRRKSSSDTMDSKYCKSTNFGMVLYLANLANCVSSLIFVAANIYVDRTLHRRAAGRRQI